MKKITIEHFDYSQTIILYSKCNRIRRIKKLHTIQTLLTANSIKFFIEEHAMRRPEYMLVNQASMLQ